MNKERATHFVDICGESSHIDSKSENWKHTDRIHNPADLLTRGVSPRELIDNEMWLHGTDRLALSPNEWPITRVMMEPPAEALSEVHVHIVTTSNDQLRIRIGETMETVPLIEYSCELEKIVNILCNVKRFIIMFLGKTQVAKKRKRRGEIVPGILPPTNEENTQAMLCLIRRSQQLHLNREIEALSNKEKLPEKSKLESLDPRLDDNGLI